MGSLPFLMPPPQPSDPVAYWNGREFQVGAVAHRVLCYATAPSGWTDELTQLHEEETAGGSHFIDRASRARAISALRRFLAPTDNPTLLEVGVSGGHFLENLRTNFPGASIVGADYTRATLEKIAPRFEGLPLVQMDLTASPFPSREFDAIILLNVLEHIERDDLAVQHCFRMMRPGGILVAEVPAGPNLYDAYDRELMHFRRYRRSDLTALMRKAGFSIEEASHIGFFFYPAFWLSKKSSPRDASVQSGHGTHVRQSIRRAARISALGDAIMRTEAWLARHVELPYGIRCTAIGRKPPDSTS
jgi:2-polyprenyl-3-methyl-5-hydroxy-6-metoxy-1,4-benzoquinol methylase